MLWRESFGMRILSTAAVFLVLSLAGCGNGDGNGPIAGELLLSLNTPNDDDRAVSVVIEGLIREIEAAEGYEIFKGTPGSSSSVILVRTQRRLIGMGGEVVARVRVDDLTAALNYAVRVQEAAAADYDVRSPMEVANYLAELVRQSGP